MSTTLVWCGTYLDGTEDFQSFTYLKTQLLPILSRLSIFVSIEKQNWPRFIFFIQLKMLKQKWRYSRKYFLKSIDLFCLYLLISVYAGIWIPKNKTNLCERSPCTTKCHRNVIINKHFSAFIFKQQNLTAQQNLLNRYIKPSFIKYTCALSASNDWIK